MYQSRRTGKGRLWVIGRCVSSLVTGVVLEACVVMKSGVGWFLYGIFAGFDLLVGVQTGFLSQTA